MPGTGYQHMVHDYYVKRLRATYTERRATSRYRARLRTSPTKDAA